MPIYEYRCTACGLQQEFLQKISDAPMKDCPECGKPALTKMVTAAGFHLKGSGWYATDFKNTAKSKPEAKAADKPAAADDKAAAKSDSKPASDAPAAKADAPKAAAGGGSTAT